MNLAEYQKSLTKTHKPRTVVFLVKNNRVLLLAGEKIKRDFLFDQNLFVTEQADF